MGATPVTNLCAWKQQRDMTLAGRKLEFRNDIKTKVQTMSEAKSSLKQEVSCEQVVVVVPHCRQSPVPSTWCVVMS